MSAHTPGPWTFEVVEFTCGQIRSKAIEADAGTAPLNNYYQTLATVTQRDNHKVYGGGITREQMLANTALIAAAPEMLAALIALIAEREACENLLREFDPGFKEGVESPGLWFARNVVAKAKGQP
jgi:hypothetical protein